MKSTAEEIRGKDWHWRPGIGFAKLALGSPISEALQVYRLKNEGANRYTGLVTFTLENPELDIYVRDERIDSFNCYELCWYHGLNLVGATLQAALDVIGEKPFDIAEESVGPDDELQQSLSFEEAGLQLWVDKHGLIVNVICSTF